MHTTPAVTATVTALPTWTAAPMPTSLQETSEPPPFQLPQPPQERTGYALQAELDYAAHKLSVQEQITYTNRTGEALPSILLVVDSRRYPGTFELLGIYDAAGERFSHRLEDTALRLNLTQPLLPGETIRFSLNYILRLLDVGRLPALRPYPLGYTDLQTNFGDWYPYIPPYVPGVGWLAHAPAFYGEYQAYETADFDVIIRLVGKETNLVIAAGAPLDAQDEVWHYRHAAARSFAWSASPYYQVLTQTVTLDAAHSVLLASYFFPAYQAAGQSLLDTMARALPDFSRRFGVLERPVLAGVQADFIDGMEYDGLYFLSSDFYNWHKDGQEDFLVALAAHETAHQWWYGLVGNDQARQPWLDEALCTYSEHLYYETVYPQALEWWWTYRVNYYEPEGWVDISVFEVPAVVGQYRIYRNPVYLRGALFMQELRTLMGDEVFFAALRDYAGRYAYGQADAAGFWTIIRAHTEQEMEPLMRKYFGKADCLLSGDPAFCEEDIQ